MKRAIATNPKKKKRLMSELTQNQMEKMLEFAQSIGWKLCNQEEELINDFCSKIGVEKRVLKVWMRNYKNNSAVGGSGGSKRSKRDTQSISDILPECLIHKIVSYLSLKEAAQMSILSKTWLEAWMTHPNLVFTTNFHKGDMKIVDQIMERYRERKIVVEKFEFWMFSSESRSGEVFNLLDKWIDIALQNGMKELLYRDNSFASNLLYPVPIFKILAVKSLTKLVLTRCDLMHISLHSGLVKCDSLRELSLSIVRLDEKMLQTLLASCPLIVNFVIELCTELKKIELVNLQNIKSVSISVRRDQRVKIQAPTLEHLSYVGDSKKSAVLDVVECQNLKSLELSHVRISGVLKKLISRSKFLKSLTLNHVSKKLGRFNIGEKQLLKNLKIKDCKGIREIDAPNLVSLEYTTNQIPELEIAKGSSQLKHTKIVLYYWKDLNVAWFCKFRNFLSNWSSGSKVSLYFSICNEINIKELILDTGITIPQVDVLEIDFRRPSKGCPTFVDALLWSCHPRSLKLRSSGEMVSCFIDRLMYMKNSSDSTSHESKPWHSQLKEVKAYTFDRKNKQHMELRSEHLVIRTPMEKMKAHFLLDW